MLFIVKQKTTYERRIRDWSSDVCSSDLVDDIDRHAEPAQLNIKTRSLTQPARHIRHVGDLRAEMKMDLLHGIEAAGRAQHFKRVENLWRCQSKLGFLAAGVLLRAFEVGRQAHEIGRAHV